MIPTFYKALTLVSFTGCMCPSMTSSVNTITDKEYAISILNTISMFGFITDYSPNSSLPFMKLLYSVNFLFFSLVLVTEKLRWNRFHQENYTAHYVLSNYFWTIIFILLVHYITLHNNGCVMSMISMMFNY